MATDQIRQMVNFILQEAHEKANEIRVKVGKDRFDARFQFLLLRSDAVVAVICLERRLYRDLRCFML